MPKDSEGYHFSETVRIFVKRYFKGTGMTSNSIDSAVQHGVAEALRKEQKDALARRLTSAE